MHRTPARTPRQDSAGVPETARVTLDAIDLAAQLRCPVPMRAAVRMALLAALTRIRLRQQAVHPGHSSNFACAEFVPHCSPHAPRAYSIVQLSEGARGARNCWRTAAFQQGNWAWLLDELRRAGSCRRMSRPSPSASGNKPARRSRGGVFSRAHRCGARARHRGHMACIDGPPRCMSSTTAKAQPASRRAAAGHSGCAEHLKTLLADVPTLAAAERVHADVPAEFHGSTWFGHSVNIIQHQLTAGGTMRAIVARTMRAIAATSPKAKAVSKVRWPRPFPHWDSIELRPWTCGTRTNHWKSVGWSIRTS